MSAIITATDAEKRCHRNVDRESIPSSQNVRDDSTRLDGAALLVPRSTDDPLTVVRIDPPLQRGGHSGCAPQGQT